MTSSPDPTKFILPAQVAGIDRYTFDDGPARGTRAFCVNTGAGLRYRILPDRGLDIDQAFLNQHSLSFLTYGGVTAPTRALDRGLDWLRSFPGGLLTSCGPFNTGGPVNDAGEDLGLHGPHSNTAATIESVIQPDPHAGQLEMSVTGVVKYATFYGPNVQLRRTILSTLGSNSISITDEFFNAGNRDVPHAWLLHINFGYPLIDAGTEFCYAAARIDPLDDEPAKQHFRQGNDYKKVPAPMDSHRGPNSFVAYLYPKSENDRTTVGVVNRHLNLGVTIRYNTKEFPRCAHWQHYGPGEYVAALEPANGGVENRAKDRANRWLDTLAAGARKKYQYEIEAVTNPVALNDLLALNVY